MVVLLSRLAVGVGNTVEEVLRIENLAQPFIIVGVGDGSLVRNALLEFRRELRQEVTYIVYFLIITNLIFY